MYINSEKNSIICTDKKQLVSTGENLFFDAPLFINIFYPDGSLCDSAVKCENGYIRAKNTAFIDLKKDALLCFFKRNIFAGFKLLAQSFTDIKVSVYIDNGLKVLIDTNKESEIFCYNFLESNAKIHTEYISNFAVVFIYFSVAKKLAVFMVKDIIEEILFTDCVNFSLNNTLTVIEHFKDIGLHKRVTEYFFKGDRLIVKGQKVSATLDEYPFNLKSKLLPIAFLEEFLIGGDFEFFLSSELKEKTHLLSGYLGCFNAVMPSPFNTDEIGLIYKSEDNGFDYTVKYISFDITDGKITNFNLSD
ncbi:MAG: hypothetical protein J6V68_04885 [Clostridia bacterium]|nr:hypothetical protein [Clostridia bacterium]